MAREILIHCTPFTIGRAPTASLSIKSAAISRLHAEIRVDDDKLLIVDLGSTNGSFVNGFRIKTDAILREGDLLQFGETTFRVGRRTPTCGVTTGFSDVTDWAFAAVQFDKLLSEGAVITYFQPLADLQTGATMAYEVLGRSYVYGLRDPQTLFAVASRLDQEKELSQLFRAVGVSKGKCLPEGPPLFLNTHPREVEDVPTLIDSLRQVRDAAGTQKLVLEIHEQAVTSPAMIQQLAAELRNLGIGLAYDDFGSGNARLLEAREVPPDYLKFDMRLIQGIHHASREKQMMVADLVKMARDLKVCSVAEGVETHEDNLVCQQMGFNYGQGYFYGKPAPLSQFLGDVAGSKPG